MIIHLEPLDYIVWTHQHIKQTYDTVDWEMCLRILKPSKKALLKKRHKYVL